MHVTHMSSVAIINEVYSVSLVSLIDQKNYVHES